MLGAPMRFLAVPLLFAVVGIARADEAVMHADLLCDRGVAVVRFASAENDDPPQYAILPPKLDGGLSGRPGTGHTDCQLARGLDIRIRTGEEQAFHYGAGGGDPPAFFSLWIDRRRILSKFVWKPGYGESFGSKPWLVGLVVRGKSLTFCYRKADDKAVRCEQQRLELRGHPVDPEEYPAGSRPKPGVGTILIEPADAACQRYLDAIRKDARLPFDGLPYDSPLFASMSVAETASGRYALSTLDGKFANVGARRVVTLSSDKHYFDGDIVVLVPQDTSIDDVVAAFPGEDIEDELARPSHAGWTVISGGQPGLYPNVSPRYVHLLPEAIDGELFYLAYPTNRDKRPTGILVKPLPAAGFAPLCKYQREEPHY